MTGPRNYSAATRAALVSLSNGTCYYPGCPKPLIEFVEGQPEINYDIAHVRDAKEGNRYDPAMTDEERSAYANLVLLCKPHHKFVDGRSGPDANTLVRWKRSREDDAQTRALGALGAGADEQLEDQLISAILVSGSSVRLGGQGGSAPGAGGGGGGVLGSGVAGNGGPGGSVVFDGQPGRFPGAGGGGGGVDGPDGFAGDGGEGGECRLLSNISLDEIEALRMEIGEGGLPGELGGDTSVTAVHTDGTTTEIARGRAGRPGRSGLGKLDERDGPPFVVQGAFFAHGATVADGLLYTLGGGWDIYTLEAMPGPVDLLLVVILETTLRSPHQTELLIELFDSDSALRAQATPLVQIPDGEPPLCLKALVPLSAQASRAATWLVRVSCGAVILSEARLRVTDRTHDAV